MVAIPETRPNGETYPLQWEQRRVACYRPQVALVDYIM